MPIPTQPNGGQSALELAAIEQRKKLIPINTYNSEDQANEYSVTHTRALADNLTPNYGKGTGTYLDIFNYNGGSYWDIHGNQSVAIGSGRIQAFANNRGTWGYDNDHTYKAPNTSGNIGQIII